MRNTTTNPFDEIFLELASIRTLVQQKQQTEIPIVRQNENELLTCDEVLKIFHVSRPTLRRWERNKKLVPIRIGRRMLFRKVDIDNLTGINLSEEAQR